MSKNAKKPIILKRMLIQPAASRNGVPIKTNYKNISNKLIRLATIPLYREDVIFESNGESFLPGEYQSVKIMNKLNNLTSNCQTIAHCTTKDHEIIVKTSENVTQVIGPEAYNSLFYALCSVINQEYRIKAILALLTVDQKPPLKIKTMGTTTTNKSCQTNETRIEVIRKRSRKRVRKVPVPYAVKSDEKLKKLTVIPLSNCSIQPESLKKEETEDSKQDIVKFQGKIESVETVQASASPLVSSFSESGRSILPDLGYLQDDNSNDSFKSFSTLHSFRTVSDLLINPISLVDNVDRHTKELVLPNHKLVLMDGTEVKLPFKPEDMFHIATNENLQLVDNDCKKKLLFHQMQIDYQYCLSLKDEDGNLPIHIAVINDDILLLKRQCVVLKIKNQSVDVPACNGLTALKLSLFRESAEATSVLLQYGADPFLNDEEHSTCAHLAAELKTDHLSYILNHCRNNARIIILQHCEELQKPGWEEYTDEQLSSIVLHHLCSLFDKQGYTPLMLASKLGHYENVRLLVESAPNSVQLAMPTSGNTALFLAVAAACTVSAERGNKSKVVDHFRKTVEILLDAGADPSIENNCGSNVNYLLQEFNCAELSMLVANKITHKRFNDEDCMKNCDKFILVKVGDNVSIQEIKPKQVRQHGIKKVDVGNDVTKKESFGTDVTKKAEIGEVVIKKEDLMAHVTQKAEIGKNVTKMAALLTDVSKKVEIGKVATKKANLGANVTAKADLFRDVTKKSEPVAEVVIKDEIEVKVTEGHNIVVQNVIKNVDIANAIQNVKGSDKVTKLDLKKDNEHVAKGLLKLSKDVEKDVTQNQDVTKKVNVTKKVDVTREASVKPVITENILLKTPISIKKSPFKTPAGNSKDFVIKPKTEHNIRKVLMYPLKRKTSVGSKDAKIPKITK